jgi:hypothetical protein
MKAGISTIRTSVASTSTASLSAITGIRVNC